MDGDLNRNTYFTYKSLFPLSDQESCRAREELAAGACATDGRGHEEGWQQEEPGEFSKTIILCICYAYKCTLFKKEKVH